MNVFSADLTRHFRADISFAAIQDMICELRNRYVRFREFLNKEGVHWDYDANWITVDDDYLSAEHEEVINNIIYFDMFINLSK